MIFPDGDVIVKPENIHYYKEFSMRKPDYYLISIDPAFLEKSTADNTAILVLTVYKEKKAVKIYYVSKYVSKSLQGFSFPKRWKILWKEFTSNCLNTI